VTLEVDFHHCPCELLSFKVEDIMGTRIRNIFKDNSYNGLDKYVIAPTLNVIEKYEEPEKIDVTHILEKMNSGLGCKVAGKVEVYRAPGSFKISTVNIENLDESLMENGYRIDFTHRILKL
jgi:hypothetical protein